LVSTYAGPGHKLLIPASGLCHFRGATSLERASQQIKSSSNLSVPWRKSAYNFLLLLLASLYLVRLSSFLALVYVYNLFLFLLNETMVEIETMVLVAVNRGVGQSSAQRTHSPVRRFQRAIMWLLCQSGVKKEGTFVVARPRARACFYRPFDHDRAEWGWGCGMGRYTADPTVVLDVPFSLHLHFDRDARSQGTNPCS
jgi:hypothetical protein